MASVQKGVENERDWSTNNNNNDNEAHRVSPLSISICISAPVNITAIWAALDMHDASFRFFFFVFI